MSVSVKTVAYQVVIRHRNGRFEHIPVMGTSNRRATWRFIVTSHSRVSRILASALSISLERAPDAT